MALLTLIGRLSDGLPLAANSAEDEVTGQNIYEYQNQGKMLMKKLSNQSPDKCTIETGPYRFHYLIDLNVCYMVLCEKNLSKRAAFMFLEDISQEFNSQYGRKVSSAVRPYTFIEFDAYIRKAKKVLDSRGRRNMNELQSQLNDVQRIMVQNIDDVLQRGTVLSELDTKTQNLTLMSQKYKKDAAVLNSKSFYIKAILVSVILFVIFLYFFIL